MRIPRIYHEGELRLNKPVALSGSAATHLVRVLRLGSDDPITLFNGNGGEFSALITEVIKRQVIVTPTEFHERERESPLILHLAQGISKGERMDYTIQKAVELGVSEITPIATERSVVNVKGERMEKKLRHWRGIISSACEQCGRNTLPILNPVETFSYHIGKQTDAVRLLLDHRAEGTIHSIDAGESVELLIGPEGGLSPAERDAAIKAGYRAVRFGPRILRTETAAVAALAVLQAQLGDLG